MIKLLIQTVNHHRYSIRMETVMKLALSSTISKIDKYSQTELGISLKELMKKSGEAIVRTVRKRVSPGSTVAILAGKGNNGGDGYCVATVLMDEYDVTVFDIFSAGQKGIEGREFLSLYKERGGKILNFEPTSEILSQIKTSNCIIDAVFGTGFHGEMPESIRPLAITVREAVEAQKIAVDVPLGINADNGSVSEFAIAVGATVELSFVKPGIVSYPARSYVGEIVYDSLGLPEEKITSAFPFKYYTVDESFASLKLPIREANSNKGSFGKLLVITGSKKYRGAAHLSLESALRGGVGLVSYLGCEELIFELSQKYPEVIYNKIEDMEKISDSDIAYAVELSKKHTATLIGSGSDSTDGLLRLVLALLSSDGGTLILDADAINVLATMGEDGIDAIKSSKRKVVLTPHPLEFARLIGTDVASVQSNRLAFAENLAQKTSATVVLKGAGTVIADENEVYINVNGSSALAKAGSGDVLAGLIGSFSAQNKLPDNIAAALAVYYHALAADVLAAEFSSYGVTPSDLPREIARQIAKSEGGRQ